MSDRAWYYASGGQQRGPVKTAQLKQMATSGELKPEDLVWCEGMPNWSPASTVKGLFSADASRPADASATAATGETLPHAAGDSAKSAPAGEHQYREQLQAAREFAAQASREAAGAFKTLVADPIGGLAPCFAKLGNTRAMQVGVVFLIAAVALYALAALMTFGAILSGFGEVTGGEKAKYFFKTLIAAVVAVGAMIGVSYGFRSMISRAASLHADLFAVGVAAMPFALATFLTSFLRTSNTLVALVALAIVVFGAVFSVLILFNAQTTVARLSERTGALAAASIAAAGAIAHGLVMWMLS